MRVPQEIWNWAPSVSPEKGLAEWVHLQTVSLTKCRREVFGAQST